MHRGGETSGMRLTLFLFMNASGPARFDWMTNDSVWVYRRSKAELVSLLEQELSELLGSPVSLKN